MVSAITALQAFALCQVGQIGAREIAAAQDRIRRRTASHRAAAPGGVVDQLGQDGIGFRPK